jgi:hypothetical protein
MWEDTNLLELFKDADRVVTNFSLTKAWWASFFLLALCNFPKAVMAVTEATSKPLRVLDLALQDSERDLSV